MFKPEPMAHASIVVLERDERAVLRCLGRLGVMHLTRAAAGAEGAPLPPLDHRIELTRGNALAARVKELQRTLELETLPPVNAGAEMSFFEIEANIALLEKSAGDLLQHRERLANRAGKLAGDVKQWSDFRGLGIPLDRPEEPGFLHFVTGTMPAENFARLQSGVAGAVALLPGPTQKGKQPLVVMTTRQNRLAMETVLRQAGFEPATLPVADGDLDGLLDESRRQQEKFIGELNQADAARQALGKQFALPLAEMELTLETEHRLLEAAQNFARTERAVLLTGWVPAADLGELQNRLRGTTEGHYFMEAGPAENFPDEPVPVLLRHPRWLGPFERLVTAYGLPHYRELEPTLFVAISYVLMFGAMFGDVGHGAILALGGLIAMGCANRAEVREAGWLFLFAGGSSLCFGFLYGSLFGLPWFKQFALWHDPLEGDPMSLMRGAIAVGVGMISLGLVLNVINRCRRGDVSGGLLGKFGVAGVVFYWGSLLLLTQSAAIQAHGVWMPAMIVVLVLPLAAWTLKEPVERLLRRCHSSRTRDSGEGLMASVIESLVGAFEAVVGYFANTISFVRLAAYAMSHAALLMAAFLVADDVKQISPAGGLLGWLVIILGNLAALVLEGLVASVQALRLEYYEFFGKFFSGGGCPFEPFRLRTNAVANTPR